MDFLATRIPPLLLTVIFAAIMWLVALFTYDLPQLVSFSLFAIPAALFVSATGVYFCVAGVMSFQKANTTVNPTTPEKTSSLVTNGIYQMSRNPMYVGFLFWLIAWGIYLESIFALLFSFLFIFYMNHFQIRIEEQFLKETFGEEFNHYRSKVRRWL